MIAKSNIICRTASPFPTASSRDAFWPPHCSPSPSASCSTRQKTASTSVSEQTAVSSTFGVSSHARKPSRTHHWAAVYYDCALLAHTEEALRHIVNRFFHTAKNFGLIISQKKKKSLGVLPTPLHDKCTVLLSVCTSGIVVHSYQRVCKNWPSTFPKILICEESAITTAKR